MLQSRFTDGGQFWPWLRNGYFYSKLHEAQWGWKELTSYNTSKGLVKWEEIMMKLTTVQGIWAAVSAVEVAQDERYRSELPG